MRNVESLEIWKLKKLGHINFHSHIHIYASRYAADSVWGWCTVYRVYQRASTFQFPHFSLFQLFVHCSVPGFVLILQHRPHALTHSLTPSIE